MTGGNSARIKYKIAVDKRKTLFGNGIFLSRRVFFNFVRITAGSHFLPPASCFLSLSVQIYSVGKKSSTAVTAGGAGAAGDVTALVAAPGQFIGNSQTFPYGDHLCL